MFLLIFIFIIVSFYFLYKPPLIPGGQVENEIAEEFNEHAIALKDPGYQMQSPGPRPILPTGNYKGIPIYKTDAIPAGKGPAIVCVHEPFESTSREKIKQVNGRDVLFLNAYTGIIYQNPGLYSPNGSPLDPEKVIEVARSHFGTSGNIAYFGTYRDGQYTDKFPDLKERQDLALYGKTNGWTQIFGQGWPFPVKHNSRGEPQQQRYLKQLALLRDKFAFSICSENTCVETYITEKIFSAIEGYTLPIYKGNNGIEKYFDEDSFIDVRKFHSPEDIYRFIKELSMEQYCARLKKCVVGYNKCIGMYNKEAAATRIRLEKEMELFRLATTNRKN